MAVKKPKHPASNSSIKTPTIPDDLLSFSFRHLDLSSNPKFRPDGWGIQDRDYRNYLATLLNRLKDLSGLRWGEIVTNQSKALRAHSINWDDTTEIDGFTELNSQLKEHQAFQFQLTTNEHGRVHGFEIDGVFYVVWLDPEHRLYQ